MPIHASGPEVLAAHVLNWALAGESRRVNLVGLGALVAARDSAAVQEWLRSMDHVAAASGPLVWLLGRHRRGAGARCAGPELVAEVCAAAARVGLGVAFVGDSATVLDRMANVLRWRHPALRITAKMVVAPGAAPGPLDLVDAARLVASGTGVVLVGLACPRGEEWLAAQGRGWPLVWVGVGGAFEVLAGTVPRAPRWVVRLGGEWLHRFFLYRHPQRWRTLRARLRCAWGVLRRR